MLHLRVFQKVVQNIAGFGAAAAGGADAEPGDIPVPKDYVSTSTMTSRLKDKDTKRDRELAARDASSASTLTELKEAQARLKELDDADKTADQLRDQALTEANARFEAQKELTATATARGDQLYQNQKNAFLRDSVTQLINESSTRALRPATALREAIAENRFSVADTEGDGNFSLQLTKGDLPVENIADGFGDWYKTRPDLHAKTGTSIPSPGAARPPGAPPPVDPLEGLPPGYAQMERALRERTVPSVPVVPDQE